MSAAASWSYTAKATRWQLLSRSDWANVKTFGPPEVFACDYSAAAERLTDDRGVEFTSRQILHTEKAGIAQGDMVLIGESAATDPIAAGAAEVRSVTRYSDTFDRLADDWRIAT